MVDTYLIHSTMVNSGSNRQGHGMKQLLNLVFHYESHQKILIQDREGVMHHFLNHGYCSIQRKFLEENEKRNRKDTREV